MAHESRERDGDGLLRAYGAHTLVGDGIHVPAVEVMAMVMMVMMMVMVIVVGIVSYVCRVLRCFPWVGT
jgi:hypothetical protein